MYFYLRIWHEDGTFYRGYWFSTCKEMIKFADKFNRRHPCERWIIDYFVRYERKELMSLFL